MLLIPSRSVQAKTDGPTVGDRDSSTRTSVDIFSLIPSVSMMRLEITGTFVGDKVGAWQLTAGEEMYCMIIAVASTMVSMMVLAKASVIIAIGCSRVFRALDRANSYC